MASIKQFQPRRPIQLINTSLLRPRPSVLPLHCSLCTTVLLGCRHTLLRTFSQVWNCGNQLTILKFILWNKWPDITSEDEFFRKIACNSGGWSRRKWDLRPDGSLPLRLSIPLLAACVTLFFCDRRCELQKLYPEIVQRPRIGLAMEAGDGDGGAGQRLVAHGRFVKS